MTVSIPLSVVDKPEPEGADNEVKERLIELTADNDEEGMLVAVTGSDPGPMQEQAEEIDEGESWHIET